LNGDLCPTCFEDSLENNDEEIATDETTPEPPPIATPSPQTATTTPDAAIQSDRLGETLVSA